MGVRKWLALPFGAASGTHSEQKHGALPENLRAGHEAKDSLPGIPRHELAAAYAEKNEEDAVEDFNAPIRWWVVCTLFPLIAGTFGPMASAFNICAVAIDWRIIVDSTSTEAEGPSIQDPQWLVAVNAISLVIAIIANLFLLAQMSGRIRFGIAAPVTIIGWYISGLIDVALVAAAPTRLPLPTDVTATWSQAYYYACFAGALYVILSIMLSCTAAGVWIFHFSTEFKLSTSQRSLMLQTMMYLGYLLSAAAVYSYIEGWNYLDAVYFVNVTLFTIGFGDVSPKTHLGRSLLFPMAIGGVLFVGLIIADVRNLVLESGSRKITTRVVEKARYKALSRGDPKNGVVKIRGVKTRHIKGETELERRAEEFQVMRDILASAAHDNRIITLVVSASSFFLLWLVGAVVFWTAEGTAGGENWSYFESLYFTYIALLTIGYGDFYPQTNAAKPAFVFWSLIALPTLTVLIGSVGDAVSDFVDATIKWIGTRSLKLTNAYKAMKARKRKTTDKVVADDVKEVRKTNDFEEQARLEALRVIGEETGEEVAPKEELLQDHDAAKEAGFAYRPYMVIKEIKKLVTHLDETPERQYTFAEWTKFLELLNDDESMPEGHRNPGDPSHAGLEAVSPPLHNAKRQAWSWMGQESPLMSNEHEPKWILNRLIRVLERELKDRGDKHVLNHVRTEQLLEDSTRS